MLKKVSAVAAVGAAITLAGCGGESALRAGEEAAQVARGVRLPPPTVRTSFDLALGHLAAVANNEGVLAIRRALGDLTAEEDPLSAAVTKALCAGMQQLATAEPDASASETAWEDFLTNEVQSLLPQAEPQEIIDDKVKTVVTTLNLADVSPAVAARYWEACHK